MKKKEYTLEDLMKRTKILSSPKKNECNQEGAFNVAQNLYEFFIVNGEYHFPLYLNSIVPKNNEKIGFFKRLQDYEQMFYLSNTSREFGGVSFIVNFPGSQTIGKNKYFQVPEEIILNWDIDSRYVFIRNMRHSTLVEICESPKNIFLVKDICSYINGDKIDEDKHLAIGKFIFEFMVKKGGRNFPTDLEVLVPKKDDDVTYFSRFSPRKDPFMISSRSSQYSGRASFINFLEVKNGYVDDRTEVRNSIGINEEIIFSWEDNFYHIEIFNPREFLLKNICQSCVYEENRNFDSLHFYMSFDRDAQKFFVPKFESKKKLLATCVGDWQAYKVA